MQDFQDEATVNALGLKNTMKMMKLYELKLKKEGKGEAVFGKDNPIPTRIYEQEDDNCASLLHKARYEE